MKSYQVAEVHNGKVVYFIEIEYKGVIVKRIRLCKGGGVNDKQY